MKRGKQESQRDKQKPARGFTRDLTCEEMSRLYAAHELSPAEASKFEAHLAGCESCKECVSEWRELFSLLSSPTYSAVHLEPSRDFDKPVMAFVKTLISQRQRAAALARHAEIVRRRAIWVAVASIAVVLFIFSRILGSFAPSSHGLERPTELVITVIVGVLHKGFDWLVSSFMNGLKIGEIFVQLLEKLRPIFNALGVAARHLDPQLVVMEVLLFMLTLLLLKGLLGTAPKGRCTNVGIII